MKNFIVAFRLTIVMCLFLGIGYVMVLWVFGKVAGPGKGNAEVVELNGKVVGAANVGQQFTQDIYFWGRPSCAGIGYDAANSCGSNKGPTNPEYLAEVENRINTFLAHHPYLQREDIPAEMVTASGSGLDPDITPQCARIQARRVAEARHIDEKKVDELVEKSIEHPLLGLFGTEKVNVLKLNIALDKLDNAEYDSSWDFTATSFPEGATDGASLTSIVKSSLTVGGTTYTSDAPQSFFGAKK